MSSFARVSFAQARRGCQPRLYRGYTTGDPAPAGGGRSNKSLLALAIGIPAVYYFWPRSKNGDSSRGANQEYKNAAEGNQQGTTKDPAYDEPRAVGSTKGPNSQSFKQEGLSNADTMNPFVNEPGKSQKGEGETETAKIKGTVSPSRPQA